MENISFFIGGDLVPMESNMNFFESGEIEKIVDSEILSFINECDFRIFNLETPLCNTEDPIPKTGPNLIASEESINGILKLNPSLIMLANNHILDQNQQGMEKTIELLNNAKIPYIGAGKNLNEASKPYTFEKKGIKIGVANFAEHEFSIATETSGGANPFDPFESLDLVSELKSECDYVIVIYHGGKEEYRYPSPKLQKVCRKLVDKGADAVFCQHSHCIGSLEEYKGAKILYGQGDFIFRYAINEFRDTSLLVKLTFGNGIHLELVPICAYDSKIRLANEEEKEKIMSAFYQRNEQIKEPGFIEENYAAFAEKFYDLYLKFAAGMPPEVARDPEKKADWISGANQLLAISNIIRCEALHELFLTSVTEKIKKTH